MTPPAIEIFIDAIPGETRMALTEEGRLTEFHVGRDTDRFVAEAIFLGRVMQAAPGLTGAFVDVGGDRPALLNGSDWPDKKLPPEGTQVLVQVSREPFQDKGATVTGKLSLPGRYAVYLPRAGGMRFSRSIDDRAALEQLSKDLAGVAGGVGGFIVRRAAVEESPDLVLAEARRLVETWRKIEERVALVKAPDLLHSAADIVERVIRDQADNRWQRIVADDRAILRQAKQLLAAYLPGVPVETELWSNRAPLFEAEGIEEQLAQALSAEVPLPSGGRIVIAETRALVAIDVDSGASGDAIQTNLEAITETMRQIRLRELAGQVVIDVLAMPDRTDRDCVLNTLKEICDGDDDVFIHGYSNLGLMELTRKRRRPSLSQMVGSGSEPRAVETGALNVIRSVLRQAAHMHGRLTVTVAPSVARTLQEELRDAWDLTQRRLGQPVELTLDAGLGYEQFEIDLA